MRSIGTNIAVAFWLLLAIGCGGPDKEQVVDGNESVASDAGEKKIQKAPVKSASHDDTQKADSSTEKSTPQDPFEKAEDTAELPRDTLLDKPVGKTADESKAPFDPPSSPQDNPLLPKKEPTPAELFTETDRTKEPSEEEPNEAPPTDDRFSNPFADDTPPPEPELPDILSAPPGKQRVAAQLEQLKDASVKVADIDFRGARIAPDDLEPLVAARKPIYLRLGETEADDQTLAALREVRELTGLGLNDTEVTDNGLAHIEKLGNLRGLRLDDTSISNGGLKHIAGLEKLEWLDLEGTKITDAGLASLAGLKKLHRLALSRTKITDDGLKHLAGMTKLEWLLLDGTAVTDAGLDNLTPLSSLKGINLLNTKTTNKAADKLRQILPRVEIYQSAATGN